MVEVVGTVVHAWGVWCKEVHEEWGVNNEPCCCIMMRSMRSRSMHEEGHEEKDHDEEHELHVRVMSMRRSMKSHDAWCAWGAWGGWGAKYFWGFLAFICPKTTVFHPSRATSSIGRYFLPPASFFSTLSQKGGNSKIHQHHPKPPWWWWHHYHPFLCPSIWLEVIAPSIIANHHSSTFLHIQSALTMNKRTAHQPHLHHDNNISSSMTLMQTIWSFCY